VSYWPQDYKVPWTLASSVSRAGIGLHSGQESVVRLHPSEEEGFQVSWTNSEDLPISLRIEHSRESQLCTTLECGSKRLKTVEHLLAALAGCGLSHVHIEVSGEEIPLLDGSALGWVEAINEAGLIPVNGTRKDLVKINSPLILNRGSSVISAIPAETFSLIGIIDFPYKAIGKQVFSIELTPQTFVEEIAPARTFGFSDQIDHLKASGLIKGGSLENALICDGDTWLNPPLRFENEPVRHKLLDLIGDLAIVGFPQAQVIVYKGSHELHADFASALLTACPEPAIFS